MNMYWKSLWFKRIRSFLDCAVLVLVFGALAFIRQPQFTMVEYIPVGVFIVSALILFQGFELYYVIPLSNKEIVISLILSYIYANILMLFAGFLPIYTMDYSPLNIVNLLGGLISFVLISILHLVHKYYLEHRKNKPRLLMLDKKGGDLSRLKHLRYANTSAYDAWYEQIDLEDADAVTESIKAIMPRFDSICLLEGITSGPQRQYIRAAMDYGKELFVVPGLFNMLYSHIRLVRFDDVLSFHMYPYSLSRTQAFSKRSFDLFAASCLFLVACIPMLIIAIAVRLTSPGPVFYTQERVTAQKKRFHIFKFRTMAADAEQKSGPVFASKNDPRITKTGGFLRKSRLDELPQLFNIFAGHMSLVGPRPERPFFVEQFEKEIDNYTYRFAVKAGLTSLSHVYGKYSTDIKDRTRYDLMYISNYSLLNDLKILLQTSRVIFLPSASEGVEVKVSSNTVDQMEIAQQNEVVVPDIDTDDYEEPQLVSAGQHTEAQ